MNTLIDSKELKALKTFIGHFSRKNSYRIICRLHKHPEGLTGTEIMDKLGVQQSEVSSTLRLLHKHGFTKTERTDRTRTRRKGKFIVYIPVYSKFDYLLSVYKKLIKR